MSIPLQRISLQAECLLRDARVVPITTNCDLEGPATFCWLMETTSDYKRCDTSYTYSVPCLMSLTVFYSDRQGGLLFCSVVNLLHPL